MNARQLHNLGVPWRSIKLAIRLIGPALKAGLDKHRLCPHLKMIVDDPAAHQDDPYFGELARAMTPQPQAAVEPCLEEHPRDVPAPWRQWGDDLDPQSIRQMENACLLPVSVAGALMPDAHVGYGLPIGGVLATDNAVIPYAVGVDIACRMKLTVLDLPVTMLAKQQDRLTRAIETETRFGIGAAFGQRGSRLREHPVMDEDWRITPVTAHLRDKAAVQLGTSGSGNHFVEFGLFHVDEAGAAALGLAQAGEYLALLSHSGSRGTGASVASHYSNLAMRMHPRLPKELKHLAWLGLDRAAGQEYWAAMNLMGRYAAANHACIHRAIARHLGAAVLADIENHHNFAWRETHVIDGQPRQLIVHRKGATPADRDVLGVIPGSMASPCYVVRGRGEAASLHSASHGAGRVMSRTQARNTFRWSAIRPMLEQRGITLLSAGLDENPFVYKNIDEVMAAQRDLVDIVARFDPKLVKMAPEGERAED